MISPNFSSRIPIRYYPTLTVQWRSRSVAARPRRPARPDFPRKGTDVSYLRETPLDEKEYNLLGSNCFVQFRRSNLYGTNLAKRRLAANRPS
jgi:hypothetical protein